MRITHVNPEDPFAPPHDGNEFDCPLCRVRLLEAFRAPATAPEPRPVALPRMEPGERLPHLILGPGHSRTVDLSEVPGHTARARTLRFVYLPGGAWAAECTCGWSLRGYWTSDQEEAGGLTAAQEACDEHRREAGNGEA